MPEQPKRPPHGTQAGRLLRAFKRERSRGVDPTQWLAPNVYDGKAPILNFGGRVAELRAAGHRIEPRGRRNGCRVLVLVDDVAATPASDLSAQPPSEPDDDALFEPGPPAGRSAIHGWEQDG